MNNSATPDSQDASVKDNANCAWSDYRKDYGVSADKLVRTMEHKAFHAGWDAAREVIAEQNIVIPRSDLPEVTSTERIKEIVKYEFMDGVGVHTATTAEDVSRTVNYYLAIVHHLQAAHSAEVAAAEKLAKRRDELAREFAVDAAYAYRFASPETQRAIDRIIELEAGATK